MKCLGKLTVFIFLLATSNQIAIGQVASPFELINIIAPQNAPPKGLTSNYNNKKLPSGYEKEALAALAYFPELKNVSVKFKVKKSFATLKTRPTLLSMFMPKGHRRYVITISNHTIAKLNPVILKNLPEAARIGIIGHELSHVVDFSRKSTWQSFKVAFGHLSKTYMDSLEYNTDKICIQHGLGKNLEAWSSYIRNTMHTTYWRGADFVDKGDTHYERYMNPATIEKYLTENIPLKNPPTAIARLPIKSGAGNFAK
ncbi:MAG: hypothetical protein ABJB11_22210 [Ferruginibacter sp.]